MKLQPNRPTQQADRPSTQQARSPAHEIRPAADPRPDSQELGRHGEDIAERWYVDRGYQVVARNWRCNSGELDLVLTDQTQLIFCEVKTRTTDQYGSGFEAVTADKQRRVRALALEFLRASRSGDANVNANVNAPPNINAVANNLRFDVASIVAGEIEVMQAAF